MRRTGHGAERPQAAGVLSKRCLRLAVTKSWRAAGPLRAPTRGLRFPLTAASAFYVAPGSSLGHLQATIATLVPRTAEGAERAGRAAAGGSGGEVREEEEEGAQSTDKDQGLDDYDGEDAVSTDEDQEEEQADDGSGCTSETTVTPAKRRRNRSAHGGKAPGKGRKYCPNPACRKVVGSPTRTCPYCKSPCTTTTSKKKKAAQPSSAAKAADLTNGAAPPMSMSMAMAMAPIVLAVQRRVAIPASAAAVAAGTTHVFVNTRQAKVRTPAGWLGGTTDSMEERRPADTAPFCAGHFAPARAAGEAECAIRAAPAVPSQEPSQARQRANARAGRQISLRGRADVARCTRGGDSCRQCRRRCHWSARRGHGVRNTPAQLRFPCIDIA